MLVAVLDVNILVSFVIVPRGTIASILTAWQEGDFGLLLSPEMIDEVTAKLRLPRIAEPYGIVEEDVRAVHELLSQESLIVSLPSSAHQRVTGDPEDDHVLAVARRGGASLLVTGDKGLLKLESYRGIQIVTPRQFLDRLETGAERDEAA